jgi:hypothetical protein
MKEELNEVHHESRIKIEFKNVKQQWQKTVD